MKFHDAANIFPLDDGSIETLSEDIKTQGLLCPIETINGEIVDGRRRFQACRMAGVEPTFVEVSPEDPIAYVLSLNLHRRHLSPSQLAMVGARARECYDRKAEERQKELGKSHGEDPSGNFTGRGDARDQVGKAVGVSGKSIDYASKVLAKGTPELVQAVDAGRIAISTAAIVAAEPEDQQREAVAKAHNRNYANTSKPRLPKTPEEKPTDDTSSEIKARGKGIEIAHEAIACLKRIPKNDALRNRGFQVVTDWIRHNK